jgi:hypothetical protein
MADIGAAVKWLKEGKRVRRAETLYWVVFLSDRPDGRKCLEAVGYFDNELSLDDVLADDWEEVSE